MVGHVPSPQDGSPPSSGCDPVDNYIGIESIDTALAAELLFHSRQCIGGKRHDLFVDRKNIYLEDLFVRILRRCGDGHVLLTSYYHIGGIGRAAERAICGAPRFSGPAPRNARESVIP
jgi:hypothetical protein